MNRYLSNKSFIYRTWFKAFIFLMVFLYLSGCIVTRLLWITSQPEQTFIYPITNAAIPNPLMGWAPWATEDDRIQQPHTLVYANLTWREFEPIEGQYGFESFEDINLFSHWRDENVRIVFRFVLDVPRAEYHTDIPDWLFEKINGDGIFYDGEYGKGFSPNYANPILIEYHQKAIAALGKRYANSDFIAFVELGSLGHWGEWHTSGSEDIPPLPDESIRNRYVKHYLEAFPNTHLMMRRPFTIARDYGLGLFNDMTGDYESTLTWLEWINNGDEYSQTSEISGVVSMPEAWKIAPIGGEQSPALTDTQLYRLFLGRTIDLLKQSHTTFIGPGGPYSVPIDSSLQSGLNSVLSTIGYRLYIKETILTPASLFASHLRLQITFGNNGIAPFYYDWPMEIYIIDEQGAIIHQQAINIDVRTILPDEFVQTKIMIDTNQIPVGKYTLGVGITDPLTGQPAVHFAMHTNREDAIFELCEVEIKKYW